MSQRGDSKYSMSVRTSTASRENSIFSRLEEDDSYDDEETKIEWSNLIFLPFHPTFKLIMLTVSIVKNLLGPIQSVFPMIRCSDVMEKNSILLFIKYVYVYAADPLYIIDIFLHIIHRQVSDKAMRREYMQKSAFLIALDIVALIPFFNLISGMECRKVRLWPNILAFTEFLTIYRVTEYYSLGTSHSHCNLIVGSVIVLVCIMNCVICFWVLLTKNGLCRNCRDKMLDWRTYFLIKLNQTGSEEFGTYIYAGVYVISFTFSLTIDNTKATLLAEYTFVSFLNVLGYVLLVVLILPKLFTETILQLGRISAAYPLVSRLLQETQRRNPKSKADIIVENFYKTIWKKRTGFIRIPDIITELPRYMRVEIKQDLGWPLIYHSTILKKRTISFKRFVCDSIREEFKQAGDRFYTGPNNRSNVYYLKSGIVQILSSDEGTTPILSVTSGTLLGDINFYLSPHHIKVDVKCLNYCEVLILSRKDYIKALHKYPEDRKQVFKLIKERLKHAKALYNCKKDLKEVDRTENEGISWLKKRWWEISQHIANWNRKVKNVHAKCELPPEETDHHCAKYIGLLVLCTETELLTKSLFTNVKFPWVLGPHSIFIFIWRKIVNVTVLLVVFLYPPNIVKSILPEWFKFFQIWTDIIYVADICISLLTALTLKENTATNFASVMFARSRTLNFNLDLLSTLWIEYIFLVLGKSQYFNVAQFNRLLKIYVIFAAIFDNGNVRRNPMISVYVWLMMTNVVFHYICSHLVYALETHVPELTRSYYFGHQYCKHLEDECDPVQFNMFGIFISWTLEVLVHPTSEPYSILDAYLTIPFALAVMFLQYISKLIFVSAMYLKFRDITNFQFFVSNMKEYYKHYKIHQDLLKRLDSYLLCHWKYYQGAGIMEPNVLKNEPYDVYNNVQGGVAEKIIGESKAFRDANPSLIKDLAFAAKFHILPKSSAIFLFGVQCKNVTWLVQGTIKCEYHDDDGELTKVFYESGYMLSPSAVFFGGASLRTYSAATDCEILYVKRQDFLKIIQRYHHEWAIMDSCITEFGQIFEEMFYSYLKKHKNYQKRLRRRVFHARRSTVAIRKSVIGNVTSIVNIEHDFWTAPDSKFMHYWLLFRMITAFVSILNASIQGGSGAPYRKILIQIEAFCNCVAWVDITLKLFLAYYDDRGVMIYDKWKCTIHYLTRTFWLDIIGAMPWYELIRSLMDIGMNDSKLMMINTYCKFAHIYIVNGYFNYLADVPTLSHAYIVMIKWLVITILLLFGTSHNLMTYCVDFKFDKWGQLTDMAYLNTCWLPVLYTQNMAPNLTEDMLHMLFAESLQLAENAAMGMFTTNLELNKKSRNVGYSISIIMIICWYITGYSLALLVLNSRGNALFRHGVTQLKHFLTDERIDKKVTKRAISHFSYWWARTKGINIHYLTNERLGAVFRQDLSYYFFKKTFLALDTILRGGEHLGRQLASAAVQVYVLPDEDVMREMDLNSWIFVVHRGKIVIYEDGEKVNSLTKGSVFGLLDGIKPRPIRITARSEGYSDLLQISSKHFQEFITQDTREIIFNHPQSKSDYMATTRHFTENPYDTIKYILRGRKTILLPWMKKPIESRGNNWYSRWLHIVWFYMPVITTFSVLLIKVVNDRNIGKLYAILAFTDFVHFTNLLLDFFTVEMVIVDKKCIQRVLGYRKLKSLFFYIDVLTLTIPMLTFVTKNMDYHFIRFMRLVHLWDFYKHFCTSFKSSFSPILLKLAMLLLSLHAIACGWIMLACRYDQFGIDITDPIPPEFIIERNHWTTIPERKTGCARMIVPNWPETQKPVFVVPVNPSDDYIIAITFVLLIHTHTSVSSVQAITTSQILYRLIVTLIMYIIDMWILSITISFVATKLRELYQFDRSVADLIKYLKHSGLSPALIDSVWTYTKLLWRRQKGNRLPELALQAPMCLREDMFCSLYMHHLDSAPLFRDLPFYFRRQLAVRLKRIVIFPGKCIVQEGDIDSCIYFIHQGEVEKYYLNKNGEYKLMSVLSTNGYFGQMAGLFPNFAYQFSYYTRTVVDLVYLRLSDWQDLLNGYPDIKRTMYVSATHAKEGLMS